MISKNQIKLIASLAQKKFRDETGLFVAEGTKLVTELSSTFESQSFFVTSDWLTENPMHNLQNPVEITSAEMAKISNQKTSQGILGIFKKPIYKNSDFNIQNKLTLALDDIQDPGNLGTIIRIADWFGIDDIFCSLHCADAYGPKTVQATMGALARVRIHHIDLHNFLENTGKNLPVYGTFMDGRDIYEETLTTNGIIVMGNEGNGISPKTEKLVTKRLLIPNFPKGTPTSESLNVSVATALVCAEFRRRN
ncbi:MAG: RNA methyltransferase [Paludibacter sp.]|nr:RNA methyltransferase [Paludibacter sp.]